MPSLIFMGGTVTFFLFSGLFLFVVDCLGFAGDLNPVNSVPSWFVLFPFPFLIDFSSFVGVVVHGGATGGGGFGG